MRVWSEGMLSQTYFCVALQEGLSDYYNMLAVLEGQVHNPIPAMAEGKGPRNYLSLQRLMV